MPANNGVPADWFFGHLRKMEQQIAQIATQSQFFFADPQGNMRVKLGLLPDGDYGLAIYNPLDGTNQVVWPVVPEYSGTPVTTSSSTYSAGTGSPEVSAYIGSSGDCLIEAGAFIQPAANTTGTLGVSIDGATAQDFVGLGSGGTVVGNPSSKRRVSQWLAPLTPFTEHTFGLQQKSSAPGSVTFGALWICVTPI
jgi:hypothetical protein